MRVDLRHVLRVAIRRRWGPCGAREVGRGRQGRWGRHARTHASVDGVSVEFRICWWFICCPQEVVVVVVVVTARATAEARPVSQGPTDIASAGPASCRSRSRFDVGVGFASGCPSGRRESRTEAEAVKGAKRSTSRFDVAVAANSSYPRVSMRLAEVYAHPIMQSIK